MTTVTDTSDEIITFTVDSVAYLAFKKYIKLYQDRPLLRVQFLERIDDDHSRDSVLTIDFHDVTDPVVTSAFELETKILAMIDGEGSGSPGGSGTIYIDQSTQEGTYGTIGGAINGSNTDFTVSQGVFTSGKLFITKNGQLLAQNIDWIELVPASGTIRMNEAPDISPEDVLMFIYQKP